MGIFGGNFETVIPMVLGAAELRNQSLTPCQPKFVPEQIQGTIAVLLQARLCLLAFLARNRMLQHGLKARKEPARSSNQYTPNTTALLLKVQSLFPRPEAHVNRLVSLLVDKSMEQGQSIQILPAHIEMFHRIFETYPEPFQESKKNDLLLFLDHYFHHYIFKSYIF
ncbi:hypothetical protein CAEBREN_12141 [Caenorhabditis brenneri]|uniref:Uncharacterized protein n=1 Tax=Caenorhabditis brenneri TaxID=135651 RepID=G0NCU1_CAEBE|nr:hypothetical protein CAEBREN_12141 [Caenorhabditis brenneri]